MEKGWLLAMIKPKAESNPFKERTRKTIIFSFVAIAVVALGLLYLYNQKEEPLKVTYPVCDLEQDEIIEKYTDYNFADKIAIEDYFFFGETLSIFDAPYNIQETNNLLGKTIVLENVCTNDEYFYLIDEYVDGQIPLDQLPEGLYEVFVNVNLVKQRAITDETLNDELNLVRRSGLSHKVEIISDKKMFDDRNHKDFLNENYLFINISNNEKAVADYDIVLDPEYGNNPTGWFENNGANVDGLIEADENYKMATLLKAELEKKGLKVLITRKSDSEIVNVYGVEGRLNRAYDSKAKYYIELGWGSSEEGGLRIYNSSFSSIQLSGSIAKHLLSETNLSTQNNSGVYQLRRYNGLDGIMTIREVGGKALSAATVSDIAKEENTSFALDNRYGLEGISIEYISPKNKDQVNSWKENKEDWAKQTAEALFNFLDIGENNDLSD